MKNKIVETSVFPRPQGRAVSIFLSVCCAVLLFMPAGINAQSDLDYDFSLLYNWNDPISEISSGSFPLLLDVFYLGQVYIWSEEFSSLEDVKISDINLSNFTPTSVVISWRTELPSNSKIEYGHSSYLYSDSVFDGTLTTEHQLTLSSLNPGEKYYYQLSSEDSSGNGAVSEESWFPTPMEGRAPEVLSLDDTQTLAPGGPGPSLTGSSGGGKSFRDVVNKVVTILNGAVAVILGLAVLILAYGVFKYYVAQSESTKRAEAARLVTWGVIGLFVIVSVWGIVFLVVYTFFDRDDLGSPSSPENLIDSRLIR